jgi:hypothetical protein
LLPAVEVRQRGGRLVPLDLVVAGRHALIAKDDPLAALSADHRRWWADVGAVPLTVGDVPGLRRLLRGRRVLVVRPDRYVIAVARRAELDRITATYAAALSGG